MENKILGLKIKELRSKKGKELGHKYTGEQLANDLNISRSYLGDIESGRRKAPIELLKKIANTFNVSIDYLTEKNDNLTDDSTNQYDSDLKRIERARSKMEPKDREKMMKILEASFDEYFDD